MVKNIETENFSVAIDRESIEHQLQTKTKNFYRNFDRSRDRFNRSKIWKKEIFEKQSNFMQKTPQSIVFHE